MATCNLRFVAACQLSRREWKFSVKVGRAGGGCGQRADIGASAGTSCSFPNRWVLRTNTASINTSVPCVH